MTLRTRGELALIAVTLIWGASFVLVKQTLDHVSTWMFLAARFSLTFAVGGIGETQVSWNQ